MSQRQAELLRLRDLLDHMETSLDQLDWTDDPHSIHYLAETLLRDLEVSRRVCMQVHRRAKLAVVN
jgi:hypothetical protein